jgi:hypothetical protein
LVGGRSGNRGRCAQPCRQIYNLIDIDTGKEVYDGSKGNYILSTKDLCTLEMLPELVKSGIHSLKIEGRMKSPEYVAIVTRIYRKYLNFIKNGRIFEISENDIELIKNQTITLCDRRKGIGAGGVICVLPSSTNDFKMRIFNSDGSEAEMCYSLAHLWQLSLLHMPCSRSLFIFCG